MSLVADLALRCGELEEELAVFQREQPEYWCETCRFIYPVQQAGRIVQPCPTCSQEMTPTSFNLRWIAQLRKDRDVLTEERDALNAVIRDDYVEVKDLRLQLEGYQAYSALLREALDGEVNHQSLEGRSASRRVLALPTDDTVLRARLAAERERCAKACEDHPENLGAGSNFAAAIRNLTP